MSDLTSKIMAYEDGEMDEDQAIEFFQELIDTGLAWTLQGSYGRTAKALIDAGHCVLPGTACAVAEEHDLGGEA